MIKVYLLMLSVLFSAGPSFAQTQAAMNQAAQTKLAAADQALNTTYRALQRRYKNNPAFLSDLKQAQLAWITFRDKQVALLYPNKPGMGSVTPMCRFAYVQQLTEERITQLRLWLDGLPEGETCTGTIHRSQP